MEEDTYKKLPLFFARRDEDFALWTMRIEALLESKDLLHVVVDDVIGTEGIDAITTEMKQRVLKATMYLVQSLGDKPLRAIASERRIPFVMYRKLRERYATENAATRVQLQTRLHQFRYTEGKPMSDYVDEMESVFARLDGMGNPLEESMQIAILFSSFGSTGDSAF